MNEFAKPEYSFIQDRDSGGYFLVQTKHKNIAVWGIGGTKCDRKKALKQAKDHCKNTFATLHIEA